VGGPADRIVQRYEDHAEAWAALRQRHSIEAARLDRFLAFVPAALASILDIGCGAGGRSRVIASREAIG
jgi:2-polyprenyl-3-methyl-5-hydroxy-6-metoxy-1,4-benzoquinol methylase